jgi:selenocysteine-specific elongation factor
VVTGTLLDAPLSVGEQLAAWPGGHPARIRSIQSHEREVQTVDSGRRVALNLSGTDRQQLTRGTMLGRSDQWSPTSRMTAFVKTARYVSELTDRGAYHIHVGSGSWPIRLRMLAPELAVIELPESLPLAMGDRFVLRETGRKLVVGGGRVLDPAPPSKGKEILASFARLRGAIASGSNSKADALLETRGSDSARSLSDHSGGGEPRLGIVIGSDLVTSERLSAVGTAVESTVTAFHLENPLRPGIPLATLASMVGVDQPLVQAAIERNDDLIVDGTTARRGDFEVDRSGRDSDWSSAKATLGSAGLAVPRVADLGIDRELLHALVRDGELVKISDEFVYLPGQIDEIVGSFAGMADGFTVSDFKDVTGLSRKYAVPFLEWADR